MENLLERLPELNLDEDLDDADDSGDQLSAIFSRSAHLKSLGVELEALGGSAHVPPPSAAQSDNTESVEDTSDVGEQLVGTHGHEDQSKHEQSSPYKEVKIDNQTWDRFKSEFSESLQESEGKIVSGLHRGDGGNHVPLDDLKQQLLLDAIVAMHSEHGDSNTLTGISTESPRSPSKLHRSLLSMQAMETIHESELDKLLESDSQTLLSGIQPSDSARDGLVAPQTPKLVWFKEDTEQLMKELEQLSKTEGKSAHSIENGTSQAMNWAILSNGHGQSGSKHDSKENGPIFLDLRPGPAPTAQQANGRSSTEDDDSDDPYAWISQRKHIKHTLNTGTTPPHTTTAPQASHPHISSSHTPITSPTYPRSPSTQQNPSSQTKGNKCEGNSKVMDKTSEKQSTENGIPMSGSVKSAYVSSETLDSTTVSLSNLKRERNSNSLTLSSSLSDGEANGSGVNDRESPSSPTKNPPPSPTKGNKSSKKSKKAKKARKKDKESSPVKKDSAKSAQRKAARALVLERIRNDSLTTSSDEEHWLTPTETEPNKLSSSVSSSDSALLCQGSEEDLLTGMDAGKLKNRLQKIIQTKKPPTQFVTPGTSTIFHEDVSFEVELNSTDPSRSTDALLVFSLSENGLVSLPIEAEDEGEGLDLQTQFYFHMVLLTWLSSQASRDYSSTSESTSTLLVELPNESMQMKESSVSDRYFKITGALQTILDGSPSLLVGVSVPAQLKASRSQSSKFNVEPDAELVQTTSNKLTMSLSGITMGDLITDLNDPEIQPLIPDHVLIKLNQIGQLPLVSFLTVQDEVTPLTTPLSFYWHSGYHISSLPTDESLKSQAQMSTTVCTIPARSLGNKALIFTTLQSAYKNAFYLSGLRIVYGEKPEDSTGGEMTLALALRAADAIYRWLDIAGPEDSNLAKVTDPDSLIARFGTAEFPVLQCVRTPYLVTSTLAKWFGGRACLKTGSVLGISDRRTKTERRKRQRVRFSESESEDGLPSPVLDVTFAPLISNRPCLIAQPYTKLLLIVAPLVTPALYGTVLSTCSRLGFDVLGMKRIRLNSKRASAIQISKSFMANFIPSSTPPSPVLDFVTHPLATEHAQNAPPFPSLVLHLGTENAQLHSLSLKETISSDLEATLELNPALQSPLWKLNTPESILHITEVSQESTKALGSFSLPSAVSGSLPKLHSDRNCGKSLVEELCLVAVPQYNSLPKLLDLLKKLYRLNPPKFSQMGYEPTPTTTEHSDKLGGFELLGLKVVPQIPRFHAKRLCPIASTDPTYQTGVNVLSDSPATVLLFRGIDFNQRLAALLKPSRAKSPLQTNSLQQQLEIIISSDFEDAFNLASIFFTDKEMFVDSASLGLALYIPGSWLQDTTILQDHQIPPTPLLSVVRVCLSDARLVVKVLDKLCRSGFQFAGMQAVEMDHKDGETIVQDLEESSSGDNARGSEPGLVVCVKRVNAVWHLKHVLSPYMEQRKQTQKHHIAYSESFGAAVAEVKQYFSRGLCCEADSIIEEYKIGREDNDFFGELVLPEGCQRVPESSLFTFVSPLLETSAMILAPSLLEGQPTAGFVEVVEFLFQCGFEMRGLKLVTLSQEKSRELLNVCDSTWAIKADDLCCSPCLVLVVRRDNAASCCQTIFKSAMTSSYRPGSGSVHELLNKMLVPGSAKQAQDMLMLLKADE